jgi:hypothetical protein
MDTEKEHDRTHAFSAIENAQRPEPGLDTIIELERLLAYPYQWIRIRAAELLGQLKAQSAAPLLAMALNDRCEHVASAAAAALVNIATPQALEVLRCAFLEDQVERPHYLANAIAMFGEEGFTILSRVTTSQSPTLRYYAARGLGSSGIADAMPILQRLAELDMEKTPFGGLVATSAKKGLRALRRMLGERPQDQ